MDHLAEELDIVSLSSVSSYLLLLGVQLTPGIDVLRGPQKIKTMLSLNPKTINPTLDNTTRAMYLQVLFERQAVIASSLVDLVEPARVEPCIIRTIGSPYKAPFI